MPKALAGVANGERHGYPLAEWCHLAGISDSLHYKLAPEMQPAAVKVGRKRIVTESPSSWLARVGKQVSRLGTAPPSKQEADLKVARK